MKVEAYLCDQCDTIKVRDEVSGLLDNEALFDKIEHSYKVLENHPEKAEVHFCMECYRVNVLNIAARINRSKDELGYVLAIKEAAYVFKHSLLNKVRRARISAAYRGKK